MSSPERCVQHPQRAGWRCNLCGPLCPACVAQRGAGFSTMDVCTKCGAMAAPIQERRAEQQPFLAEVPWALLWPLRGGGPLMLFTWGLFLAAAQFLHASGFGRAILLGYLFHLTRWSAHGHDDVPGAEEF